MNTYFESIKNAFSVVASMKLLFFNGGIRERERERRRKR
jgi:hypothetical protein